MFRKKLFSLLIDYFVIFCFISVYVILTRAISGIYIGFVGASGEDVNVPRIDYFLDLFGHLMLVVFCFLYYSHIFQVKGETWGDKKLKIKVVPIDREKIGPLAAIVRTAFLAPFLAVIGLIPIKGKCILDHICKTDTVDASQ